MEYTKKALIGALSLLMTEFDTEDADFFYSSSRPTIMIDGIKYEIFTIHKPDLDTMSVDLSVKPSYAFRLDYKTFTEDNVKRITTLKNLFLLAYRKFVSVYGLNEWDEVLYGNEESALEYFCWKAELF